MMIPWPLGSRAIWILSLSFCTAWNWMTSGVREAASNLFAAACPSAWIRVASAEPRAV